MVHCGIYLLNARGEKIGVDIGKNASDNMAYDLLVKGNCVSCSTVFVRRACLEDVGLFDPDLFTAEDLDLWIRIARKYKICIHIQSIFQKHGIYGFHPNRINGLILLSQEYL